MAEPEKKRLRLYLLALKILFRTILIERQFVTGIILLINFRTLVRSLKQHEENKDVPKFVYTLY